MYRPIEEVAESWEARAKNPDDHWRSGRDYKLAVEIWNLALQRTREFIESSPAPRVLIISYHDFFYRNEAVVPQISRFLGLEFDESLTRAWREACLKFESRRRQKKLLSEEQRSFIQKHADRAAEAWVLERIERQWREPGLYAEESTEAALASLDRIEAKMWRLQLRVEQLEKDLACENQRPTRLIRSLEKQLESIQSSRSRKLTKTLHRIKARVSRRLGRSSS